MEEATVYLDRSIFCHQVRLKLSVQDRGFGQQGFERCTSVGDFKNFRNSDFLVTDDVLNHLAYQKFEVIVVNQFEDLQEKYGKVDCHVKWKRFSDT